MSCVWVREILRDLFPPAGFTTLGLFQALVRGGVFHQDPNSSANCLPSTPGSQQRPLLIFTHHFFKPSFTFRFFGWQLHFISVCSAVCPLCGQEVLEASRQLGCASALVAKADGHLQWMFSIVADVGTTHTSLQVGS